MIRTKSQPLEASAQWQKLEKKHSTVSQPLNTRRQQGSISRRVSQRDVQPHLEKSASQHLIKTHQPTRIGRSVSEQSPGAQKQYQPTTESQQGGDVCKSWAVARKSIGHQPASQPAIGHLIDQVKESNETQAVDRELIAGVRRSLNNAAQYLRQQEKEEQALAEESTGSKKRSRWEDARVLVKASKMRNIVSKLQSLLQDRDVRKQLKKERAGEDLWASLLTSHKARKSHAKDVASKLGAGNKDVNSTLKTLKVYEKGGYAIRVVGGEGTVRRAFWGDPDRTKAKDVTEEVQQILQTQNTLKASSHAFGDTRQKGANCLTVSAWKAGALESFTDSSGSSSGSSSRSSSSSSVSSHCSGSSGVMEDPRVQKEACSDPRQGTSPLKSKRSAPMRMESNAVRAISALIIQRHYRGYNQRVQYSSMKDAALHIQKRYRGHHVRTVMPVYIHRRSRISHEAHGSSSSGVKVDLQVQKAACSDPGPRGSLLKSTRSAPRRTETTGLTSAVQAISATVIQRHYRGYNRRVQYSNMKAVALQKAAALQIQKTYRGYNVRRDLLHKRSRISDEDRGIKNIVATMCEDHGSNPVQTRPNQSSQVPKVRIQVPENSPPDISTIISSSRGFSTIGSSPRGRLLETPGNSASLKSPKPGGFSTIRSSPRGRLLETPENSASWKSPKKHQSPLDVLSELVSTAPGMEESFGKYLLMKSPRGMRPSGVSPRGRDSKVCTPRETKESGDPAGSPVSAPEANRNLDPREEDSALRSLRRLVKVLNAMKKHRSASIPNELRQDELGEVAGMNKLGSGGIPVEFSQDEVGQVAVIDHSGSLADELEVFQPGDQPPLLPTDEDCTVASTSLVIEDCGDAVYASHDIGNCILTFLRTKVKGSITKLYTFKYWVRAKVFLENISCTFRVQLYRDPELGYHTVQLKRNSGCPVTFDRVYEQLWQFLALRFPNISAKESSVEGIENCKVGSLSDASGRSGKVFQPGDQPPLPPTGKSFTFKSTNIRIDDDGGVAHAPHDIGNCILTFLRTQVVSSLQKLRTSTYHVRAHVVLENVSCTLKIRVYRVAEPHHHTVQFERVEGCPKTFQRVYEQAWQFFTLQIPGISSEEAVVFQLEDQPPLPPTDKDFKSTSIKIEDGGGVAHAPHDIGNCILTFLRTQVVSSLQKLRTFNYNVRAEVFLENVSCTLNIRVFRGPGVSDVYHIVHFERVTGCPLTFQRVYEQAWQFFTLHFPGISALPKHHFPGFSAEETDADKNLGDHQKHHHHDDHHQKYQHHHDQRSFIGDQHLHRQLQLQYQGALSAVNQTMTLQQTKQKSLDREYQGAISAVNKLPSGLAPRAPLGQLDGKPLRVLVEENPALATASSCPQLPSVKSSAFLTTLKSNASSANLSETIHGTMTDRWRIQYKLANKSNENLITELVLPAVQNTNRDMQMGPTRNNQNANSPPKECKSRFTKGSKDSLELFRRSSQYFGIENPWRSTRSSLKPYQVVDKYSFMYTRPFSFDKR